jgi:hypothetical protein
MGVFKRIKIRKRNTFHPDREKMGANFEMPELERIDIQQFIDEFEGAKPKDKRDNKKQADVSEAQLPSWWEREREIRNEYESQLIEKDAVINYLMSKIRQIQAIVGGESVSPMTASVEHELMYGSAGESNIIMQKLDGMPRKIYECLLQHPGGLTRRQIGSMCGYSFTSGSFSNAISKLKTMGLFRKEGDMLIALLK